MPIKAFLFGIAAFSAYFAGVVFIKIFGRHSIDSKTAYFVPRRLITLFCVTAHTYQTSLTQLHALRHSAKLTDVSLLFRYFFKNKAMMRIAPELTGENPAEKI